MSKNKSNNIIYSSYVYEVVMPQTDRVDQIKVNKLQEEPKDPQTPLYKLALPSENGFYKGLKYTEHNTLLGYNDNSWRKLRSIQFEPSADEVFGVDEINTVNKLSSKDKLIRDEILATFAQ